MRQATSPTQPFSGHQRGRGSEGDPRSPDVKLQKGRDHSEAGPEQTPLLLSYMPASIMGMSERVSNVVVSLHVVPLILLTKDQVLNLNSQGLSAFYVGDCSDQ